MQFWFSIGSTYTYLSVMRLDRVEAATGTTFDWCPFDIRTIQRELRNVPFGDKPPKLAYMWRDIERRARRHGLPFPGTPPYPLSDLQRVNRVAVLGLGSDWGKAYVRAAYRHWFERREDVSQPGALREVLAALGLDPDATLAEADAPAMHEALEARTRAARELGVFGAPTFAVGRELFWGDDRLDDAIDWSRHGAG
jgi:2-hydroxychromene-2-carboxylate isomerase